MVAILGGSSHEVRTLQGNIPILSRCLDGRFFILQDPELICALTPIMHDLESSVMIGSWRATG